MVKKLRISHYLQFNMILLYLLTIIPIVLGVTVLPWIIQSDTWNTQEKEYILLAYGIISAFYSNLMNLYQVKTRGKYSIFEIELTLYLLNYILVLFIFIYWFDLDYFANYFRGFTYSSIVFHLFSSELIPYCRYKSRKKKFAKRWVKSRKKMIKRFMRNSKEFSVYTKKESSKFKEFRRELLVRQQLEYN